MWVHSIEAIPTGAGSLITAVIDWEDNPSRAPFHLRFETEQIEHPQLETPGNALLAACFPLARHHGERRIRMEADVCPLLAEGLLTAHAWWNKWSGEHTAPPEIEAGGANAEREQPRAAAALLSGGVDSLHMLYRNRLLFATDSPVRIGQAILVHGFDMGRRIEDPQEDLFAAARSRLQSVVRSIGVELGVCRTNLRQIPTATGFWLERYYGVAAIAAGHAAIA